MARERFYDKIEPVSFTADGKEDGTIFVEDTACFKVKRVVFLKADGGLYKRLQVKRVLSNTEMVVGPITKGGQSLKKVEDVSDFTVALNAYIESPAQERPSIPPADYERAVYEEEPTVAKRVFPVDKYGKNYDKVNRFPVEGSFTNDNPNFQKILTFPINDTNEFVINLPDNTKKYRIKVKQGKSRCVLAFLAGQTVDNGANIDIERGSYFLSPDLDLPNNSKLYLKVVHPNVVVEVAVWRIV
jgi:hypothetical protein